MVVIGAGLSGLFASLEAERLGGSVNILEPFFGGVFLDTKLDAIAQIFIPYLWLFTIG